MIGYMDGNCPVEDDSLTSDPLQPIGICRTIYSGHMEFIKFRLLNCPVEDDALTFDPLQPIGICWPIYSGHMEFIRF